MAESQNVQISIAPLKLAPFNCLTFIVLIFTKFQALLNFGT